MKKNTQSTIEKLMKNFIPSDFDDLIALAKKEKADCIKKLDDEKKKKAAEILLNNMDVLLKSKENLPPEFLKQLQSLDGNNVLEMKKEVKTSGQDKEKQTAA